MIESDMLFLCRILFEAVIYAQKGQYVKITRIISNNVVKSPATLLDYSQYYSVNHTAACFLPPPIPFFEHKR